MKKVIDKMKAIPNTKLFNLVKLDVEAALKRQLPDSLKVVDINKIYERVTRIYFVEMKTYGFFLDYVDEQNPGKCFYVIDCNMEVPDQGQNLEIEFI